MRLGKSVGKTIGRRNGMVRTVCSWLISTILHGKSCIALIRIRAAVIRTRCNRLQCQCNAFSHVAYVSKEVVFVLFDVFGYSMQWAWSLSRNSQLQCLFFFCSSLPTRPKQTEFMRCMRQLSWNGNYVKYSFSYISFSRILNFYRVYRILLYVRIPIKNSRFAYDICNEWAFYRLNRTISMIAHIVNIVTIVSGIWLVQCGGANNTNIEQQA